MTGFFFSVSPDQARWNQTIRSLKSCALKEPTASAYVLSGPFDPLLWYSAA